MPQTITGPVPSGYDFSGIASSAPARFTNISLKPEEVTRLLKAGTPRQAAAKIYDLDKGFRSVADHYTSPEIMGQMDDYTRENLPQILLNRYYFGSVDPEPADELTATLSQQTATPPATPWQGIPFMEGIGRDATQNLQNISQAGEDYASGKQGFTDTALQVGANTVSGFLQPVTHVAGALMKPFSMISDTLGNAAEGLGRQLGSTAVGQSIVRPVQEAVGPMVDTLQPAYDVVKQHANDPAVKTFKATGKAAMDTLTAYGTYKAADKAVDAASQGYAKLTQKTPEMKLKELNDTVGKIVQGDTKSVEQAKRAFSQVETKGVKTYQELDDTIQGKLDTLRAAQDKILDKTPEQISLNKFGKTFKNGSASASFNPVQKAMDDLSEMYAKTGDPQNYVRIKNMMEGAKTTGLSARQVNDLAREYGSEFGRKAFNPRTGDPLTSVNSQLYENTRSALKDASRSLLPNDASKIIDSQMSDLLGTKLHVEKMVEKVNTLAQKVETRGLVERGARLVGRGINAMTFNGLRGFLQSFFPSNVGLKQMNSLEIQESLSSNLAKFEKLIKEVPTMSDTQAAAAINQFVTETYTAPLYEATAGLQNTAPTVPGKPKMQGGKPSNASVPQSNPPVNSPQQ